MNRLKQLGNPRAAVPYFLVAAVFAAVIGVAVAAAVPAVGVASASDVQHAESPTKVGGTESVSAPKKPRSLKARRLDDGSVELSWKKPRGSAAIAGYKVTYMWKDLDEPVTEAYTSGFTETPITNDEGQVIDTQVKLIKQVGGNAKIRYHVRAYNEHFDGRLSREARVTRIGRPAEISRRPSDGDTRISVCWSKATGDPTHYEIMRRMASEGPGTMRVVATVADDGNDSATWRQCHLDTSAAADTNYLYKVRGSQGSWKGKKSAAMSAVRTDPESDDGGQ